MPDICPPPWHGRGRQCCITWAKARTWTSSSAPQREWRTRRGQRARCGARQPHAAQQALHQRGGIDQIAQRIRLGAAYDAAIDHFVQQLGDDIVIALDLGREQRGAEVVFEHIGDAVQELEDLEGIGVGGTRGQEEQLVLDNRVEQRGGVGGGEVDQRRPRCRVREIERQERAARGWAAIVRVFEERCAGAC